MANLLDYDVYDLELTTVKDNSELKRLLLDTTGKSIIVIEDIDCSLDLTSQRSKKKDEDKEKEEKDSNIEKKVRKEIEKESKVTLSGLLNAVDGLWSASCGETIIVFTTNFVDKLDPALIRRGRMDRHIEMSYCRFEAFKVLAENYLDIESHYLFKEIKQLLEETDISPADVAENLMPKSNKEDAEICLKRLVDALEETKRKAEEEKKKAEEEKKKAEEEEEEEKKEEAEKKNEDKKANGELAKAEAKEAKHICEKCQENAKKN